MHGKTDMIQHDNQGLYEGLPNPFEATRYHSLVIQPDTLSDEFTITAWSNAPDGTLEIMGIQHKHDPLFGVQYHPESFLTGCGTKILERFPGGQRQLTRSRSKPRTRMSAIASRLVSFDLRSGPDRGRAALGCAAAAGTLAAGLDRAGVVGAAHPPREAAAAAGHGSARCDFGPGCCWRWPCFISWPDWPSMPGSTPWQYRLYWMADTVFWLGLTGDSFWPPHGFGRRTPIDRLWLAGMFFWLAALHWLRLPYWAIGFGWLALGIYFGCYLPVFVGLSRVGVHRLAAARDPGGPGRLYRAGTGPGAPAERHDHGLPRAFAVSLDDVDSDQRSDRLLRSDVPGDVRRRLPGPDVALRRRAVDVLAAGPGRGSAGRGARLRPLPHRQRGNRSGPEDCPDPRKHRHPVGRPRRHLRDDRTAQYRELTREALRRVLRRSI